MMRRSSFQPYEAVRSEFYKRPACSRVYLTLPLAYSVSLLSPLVGL